MAGRNRRGGQFDPFELLGIPVDADAAAIAAARKRLAKSFHPDAGGSVEQMQDLNEAVDQALAALAQPPHGRRRSDRPAPAPSPRGRPSGVHHDHPSFTIEALPAEAFEGLLIVAAQLGEVVDDDPPYLLEAIIGAPTPAWCRLELVPDAGAATVSLMVARVPDGARPDVDAVRDRWIAELNRLDWDRLDRPLPPS